MSALGDRVAQALLVAAAVALATTLVAASTTCSAIPLFCWIVGVICAAAWAGRVTWVSGPVPAAVATVATGTVVAVATAVAAIGLSAAFDTCPIG